MPPAVRVPPPKYPAGTGSSSRTCSPRPRRSTGPTSAGASATAHPLAPKTNARIEAGLRQFAQPITLEVAGNTFERRTGVRTWPAGQAPDCRRDGLRRQVAPAHCCAGAPSEPYLSLVATYGSSKPRRAIQEFRGAGSLSVPVARRRQEECVRRVWSGGPVLPWAMMWCLVIAVRMVRCHCSHSWGLWGSRSACRSRSPQIGQRPCWLWSRRSVLRSSRGLRLRRRVAQ